MQGKTMHVLFIGNSLTSANDLPGMIASMAESRNNSMPFRMYAPGGYTLANHAADPGVIEAIEAGGWDVVVLQEQSQLPALPDEYLQQAMYPHVEALCHIVSKSNPGAVIAFYMTMAKRNGDQQNSAALPALGTYRGMQERINASYDMLGHDYGALLIPVGIAWQNVRSHRPGLNLYSDDTHPNATGTYLAACVFYGMLFEESPLGLPHPSQIDERDAGFLRKAAADAITSLMK